MINPESSSFEKIQRKSPHLEANVISQKIKNAEHSLMSQKSRKSSLESRGDFEKVGEIEEKIRIFQEEIEALKREKTRLEEKGAGHA